MSAAAHGRVVRSAFRPAFGLGNAHLQTLFGGAPRLARPRPVRERWELADGDFVDLDWLSRSGSTWALVLPGLTGGLESAYALRLLERLAAAGFRAALLNYRGRSGLPNRRTIGYHAGFTRDLDRVAGTLGAQYGPGLVAGYSMGGNLLLKWLGERGAQAPVKAAVAASVPFELEPAAVRLRSGRARYYDRYLLKGLKNYARRKFAAAVPPVPLPDLAGIASIFEFDEHITAPIHGFSGARDYYSSASCRPWLRRIRTPTLIVNALDDPLIPGETLPESCELAPAVTLELAESGGHVGFLGRARSGFPRFWLDRRFTAFLREHDRPA